MAAGSPEAVCDFCEGDQVLIEIEHRHDMALWVYVLDFGLTDNVTLLYPGPGAHELLEPDILLRLGEREREEMELCFPSDFDFGGDGLPERSRGFGFIKLFMTTHATDFDCLRTDTSWPETHRIGRGSLAKLLAMGRPVEAIRIEGEDWLAVTRGYELRWGG
ncbi:MAG: hypothetical protein HC897_03350 [Thermoanaerobaculia bacterium]|nr:hypothetical protein [Thermoanaerobaculia bacterium]